MNKLLLMTGALASIASAGNPLAAAEMNIEVQIPRLDVAEYHRPYVALWLEQDNRHAADIAVWYDLRLSDEEGEKWLKDLRLWWRRSGRELDMPVDGLSAATQPPGIHQLHLKSDEVPLNDLAPGEYDLVIEAAREVGSREMLRLPFNWPPQNLTTANTNGDSELGRVTLSVSP